VGRKVENGGKTFHPPRPRGFAALLALRACVIARVLWWAPERPAVPRRSGAFILPPTQGGLAELPAKMRGTARRSAHLHQDRAGLPQARRLSARHRGFVSPAVARDTGPGSALPGTRPCGQSQSSELLAEGHNAPRSVPRASRVHVCETCPRAPPLPHSRNAPRSAPHEQNEGLYGFICLSRTAHVNLSASRAPFTPQ
jgi:hypothetical protein